MFGSAPNVVDEPENNFDLEDTWACTSRPITTSHLPCEPAIKDFDLS